MTRLPLTVAVDTAHGLGIMTRIPGGIEHDHAVRPDQVYAQTTSPEDQRGQQSGYVYRLYFFPVIGRSLCVCYLVDSRKTHADVLDGSLNWFISLSLSEAVVLPSSPSRHHTTHVVFKQGFGFEISR